MTVKEIGRSHAVRALVAGARAACAEALAAAGDRGSASFLASFLLQEREATTRRAIVKALGELGEAREVPRIVTALEREDDDLFRILALATLAKLGDRRAVATAMARIDDVAMTEQSPDISSIRPFPWNVRVGDVAVWTAATLRDGKPPFAVETLSQFPRPAPREAIEKLRAELAKWWRELGEEEKRALSLR
jgi:hypothetical protein